jgi:hypothetical protein
LGLGRDGLLPAFLAKIHDQHRTPVKAQIWVGAVAASLAGLFNVSHLSHILSVGCLVRTLGRSHPCCFKEIAINLAESCWLKDLSI